MRWLPVLYACFCLAVLGGFTYSKYEGMSLFGASGAPASRQNGTSGGHGAGFLLGGHK